MKARLLIVVAVSLMCGSLYAQTSSGEPFAGWTFDEPLEPNYWYGTSYAATYGYFPTAMLYADGSYGSSQFATVTTSNYAQMLKNDWLGTEIGDPRPEPFDGYCLGFKHPNSAGRNFVLAVPTTLYTDLTLRCAVTRSPTGFKKMTFAWSLTGGAYSYQTITSKPCDALDFEPFELNLRGLTQLENQPMIYLSITIDSIGSTAYQGNIKFDNIMLCGNKCADTASIYDSIYSGDAYTLHGFNMASVTGDGDYLYSRRVHFDQTCDSVYMLYLHLTDTTTHVIPEDTTDVDDTTALMDWLSDEAIEVYPNPFNQQLVLHPAEGYRVNAVSVYNSIGAKMADVPSVKLSNGTCVIPATEWAPGVYFIHADIEGRGCVVKKVVKSRVAW